MVDDERQPVFREKHDSFESAFPDIEDVEIEIEETDLVETQKKRNYTIENVPGREPCTNSKCTNRGIEIDRLVSTMKANDETHREFSEPCTGEEKVGRGDSRTCPHRFDIEIDITYK
ncbi:hypothetical protein [Halorubrum sp. BV1]|uniref:hypothetical protein n=1 Tax=Halorubrum sp. BV1 TaxID=1498500 RepID=UPI000679D383|nr:hypothetical protein [Halorubrum sp. BV1]